MDKIFNPSLLISIGPSAKRVLDLTSKKLSNIPSAFRNLIQYYDVGNLDEVRDDIQDIIDLKLLEVKSLNSMVDLGYKLRSSGSYSVKIDIYIFWDMSDLNLSAKSVVEILSDLNYGMLDKSQHSGASIFLFTIVDRDFTENKVSEFKSIVEHISSKENMMKIDSKAYLFNLIAEDGIRISKNEVEHIVSNLAYYNVLPSVNPPLNRFNRKLLMHEGKFKVGTVGMTSLGVDEERMLDEFSRRLSIDIIRYARENEEDIEYKDYKICSIINLNNVKGELSKEVNIIKDKDGGFTLNRIDEFEITLPSDLERYPEVFKNWEIFIENKCLNKMKDVVDSNYKDIYEESLKELRENIESIKVNYGFKEVIKFLESVKSELINNSFKEDKKVLSYKTEDLNDQLKRHIHNYPNKTGLIIKSVLLISFIFWSVINFLPYLSENITFIGIGVLFFAFISAKVVLNYLKLKKKPFEFIEDYKKKIFHKNGTLVGLYIERKVNDFRDKFLKDIENEKEDILEFMEESLKVMESLETVYKEDEEEMSFIKNILDFNDRKRFYVENKPKVDNIYMAFMKGINGCYEGSNILMDKILIFTRDISKKFITLDFYRFLLFKYGKNLEEELNSWISSGEIKNQYLLQYVRNADLEEHSSIIVSPQLNIDAKRLIERSARSTDISIIGDEEIVLSNMSLVKICLGIDCENIPIFKVRKEGGEE